MRFRRCILITSVLSALVMLTLADMRPAIAAPGTAPAVVPFPEAPSGPDRVAFPLPYVISASTPTPKVRMVFPGIAVADGHYPFKSGTRARYSSGRVDLDGLAHEVRETLRRLWSTTDGQRALGIIAEASLEASPRGARWLDPRNPPGPEEVRILVFPSATSAELDASRVIPLDPEAGRNGSGTASAIIFRPDVMEGLFQRAERVVLNSPEVMLGRLLIEAIHPLLGADRLGDRAVGVISSVYDVAGSMFYIDRPVPLRTLLAHGGESERAAAVVELRSDGRETASIWTDEMFRDRLIDELGGARRPERIRQLVSLAADPPTASRIAGQLDHPIPSLATPFGRHVQGRGRIGVEEVVRIRVPRIPTADAPLVRGELEGALPKLRGAHQSLLQRILTRLPEPELRPTALSYEIAQFDRVAVMEAERGRLREAMQHPAPANVDRENFARKLLLLSRIDGDTADPTSPRGLIFQTARDTATSKAAC